MSVELISILTAIVAVGVALAGVILASSRGLRQDMAQLESRLDVRISALESRLEAQINDLRGEVGELRERMAHEVGEWRMRSVNSANAWRMRSVNSANAWRSSKAYWKDCGRGPVQATGTASRRQRALRRT